MIVTMKKDAPQGEIEHLLGEIEGKGLNVTMISGANFNVYGIVGDTTVLDAEKISSLAFVESVQRVAAPYKAVNRTFHPEDTIIDVNGNKIGEISQKLYDTMTGMQYGKIADEMGWIVKLNG